MRIAIITESFAPDLNGVAHCVVRTAEHLIRRGHEPLVIAAEPALEATPAQRPVPRRPVPRRPVPQRPASQRPASQRPGAERSPDRADGQFPYPVQRVPSIPLPGYSSFRLGLPSRAIRGALVCHGTDVVHLASPVFLGVWGSAVARHLDLPTVAVYQTDIPAYARAYGLGAGGEAAAWRWLRRVHNAAERTLAPSTAIMTQLHAHGFERIWLWGRGVDIARFDPARRDEALRRRLAPGGEVLAGYVGRLATEKRVDLLADVARLPGVRLVVVGGGPAEPGLRERLPSAVFLGEQRGEELARTYASLDVFVHGGPYETFGQTLQEAAASGVPVVAPAVGGPLDIVADGATGYLVMPGNAAAIAEAVARLAASPGLREAQGRAARQKMLGRSWETIGDKLVGHYEAALRTARTARAARPTRTARPGHARRARRAQHGSGYGSGAAA